MAARWSFLPFDWKRFSSVSPTLKRASEAADFTGLSITEAEELLDTLEEETPPEAVANALLIHLCCAEEAALFESGLSELILWLRKQPHGEEAAETLGELVSAEPHVEKWFRVESGLVGMLSKEETQALGSAFAYFRKTYQPPQSPRGLRAFTKRFSATDPAKEHLADLMEIVDRAVAGNSGLAVLRED